jgi:thiol-disulfide isomerase/thioredoxin
MKKIVLICISVFIIGVIIFSFYFYNNYVHNVKSVDLSYGDIFPKVDIYNSDGSKVDIFVSKKKYKVIFYVSNHCQACINALSPISRVMQLYDSNDFDFLMLWENGIAKSKIEKSSIAISKNYSLHNKVRLSSLTPMGYILDENNKVIFISDADIELIINKIVELQGNPDKKKKAFDLIVKDFKSMGSEFDPNKSTLLVFHTDGCEACKNVKEKVDKNAELKNKMNIFSIEGRNSTDDTLYSDYLDIYSKIYNISFYPSYCVINNKGNDVEFYKNFDEVLSLHEN